MIDLEVTYNDRFFRKRHKLSWRVPTVCAAVITAYRRASLASIVDVGAGIGDLVKGFADLGLDSWGLEGSRACLPYLACSADHFLIEDLRVAMTWFDEGARRFDLVVCFEVAEHIEPEYADVFVDNLCFLSDRVLMSAAQPTTRVGRSGNVGHVNEQQRGYWIEKFDQRGYRRDAVVEDAFRVALDPWRRVKGICGYHGNSLCFEKEKGEM